MSHNLSSKPYLVTTTQATNSESTLHSTGPVDLPSNHGYSAAHSLMSLMNSLVNLGSTGKSVQHDSLS